MGEWDVDYVEEEGRAVIVFGADQIGEFRFGLTSGNSGMIFFRQATSQDLVARRLKPGSLGCSTSTSPLA
jgi:hypothetical protein